MEAFADLLPSTGAQEDTPPPEAPASEPGARVKSRTAHLDLHALGMRGVEADFPSCRPNRAYDLRGWAAELGLAVTGGSDCHGPEPVGRGIGVHGVTPAELAALRSMAVV